MNTITTSELSNILNALAYLDWMPYIDSRDAQMVSSKSCEECGNPMQAVGRIKYINHVADGYRAWAQCNECGKAKEF